MVAVEQPPFVRRAYTQCFCSERIMLGESCSRGCRAPITARTKRHHDWPQVAFWEMRCWIPPNTLAGANSEQPYHQEWVSGPQNGVQTRLGGGKYFEKLRQVRFLQGLDCCWEDGGGSSFRIVSILAIRSANSLCCHLLAQGSAIRRRIASGFVRS
jgi:hypothetical protein